MSVHEKVGNLIDFYIVQFFNQMSLGYDTYEKLFIKSDSTTETLGTSVSELITRGIPTNKIVIGKPVSQKDVQNTGWMKPK